MTEEPENHPQRPVRVKRAPVKDSYTVYYDANLARIYGPGREFFIKKKDATGQDQIWVIITDIKGRATASGKGVCGNRKSVEKQLENQRRRNPNTRADGPAPLDIAKTERGWCLVQLPFQQVRINPAVVERTKKRADVRDIENPIIELAGEYEEIDPTTQEKKKKKFQLLL